jgi:hypothetical protein
MNIKVKKSKTRRASHFVSSVTSCSKNPKLHRPGFASLGHLGGSNPLQVSGLSQQRL